MKTIPGCCENRSPSPRNHCSPSARNPVRLHPGTFFTFTPESRSPSPGIRLHGPHQRGARPPQALCRRGQLVLPPVWSASLLVSPVRIWFQGYRGPAQDTTSPHLLEAGRFTPKSGPSPDATLFERGNEINTEWATFGRVSGSRLSPDQSVFATYSHAELRLNGSVWVVTARSAFSQAQRRAAAPPKRFSQSSLAGLADVATYGTWYPNVPA